MAFNNSGGGSGVFSSCYNCQERKILVAHDIYNCHSFCKLYQEAKEIQAAANEKRKLETDMNAIKQEGYRRTTRNLYQKYKK